MIPIRGFITAGAQALHRQEAVTTPTKEALRAEAILTRHLREAHSAGAALTQRLREVRRAAVRIPLPAEVQVQVALLRTTLRVRAAAHRLVPPHRVPAEVHLPAPIAVEAADVAVEDVVRQ